MEGLGQAAPTEDPQAEEGRFEEEGEEGFNGERCAEDVADVSRVFRPVHAELEFLDDACCDTEGEGDEEKLAEETGGLEPVLLAGLVPERLHEGDHQRHADGQRDEDEVVDGGNTELPSSDRYRVERCLREGHECSPSLKKSSMDRGTA